jgi:hypothetical protein
MAFDFSDLDEPSPPAPAPSRDLDTLPIGPDGRLRPIYVQPLEISSEGLIQLWREAARSDLATILLPEALRTLAVIMRDAMASPNARVSAAKAVLSVALVDGGDVAVKKALHEMSASEIDAAIMALRSEVVERMSEAKPALPAIEVQAWFESDGEAITDQD